MFAGCLQIIPAHSQLILVEGVGYSQIIRAEKADVLGLVVYICRSLHLFAGFRILCRAQIAGECSRLLNFVQSPSENDIA
jgi:hypothetical protein